MVGSNPFQTVLVVEADDLERRRFSSWIEREGYDVIVCPGPTEPDYTCVGARGKVCPLVAEASVVVLDMSLESEAVVMGTAAEELLGMYLMTGKGVVVLGSHPGGEVPGQLRRLHRHPDREELVGAVLELAGHGPGWGS